jgi:hypothetical protein
LRPDFGCVSDRRTDAIIAAAEECRIELLFFPASGTGKYQQLNYRIFKERKSRAKREITRLMAIRGAVNIDYDQSVSILGRCWDAFSGESIRKAWGLLKHKLVFEAIPIAFSAISNRAPMPSPTPWVAGTSPKAC